MRAHLSLPEEDGLTLGVEEEFVLADPVTGGVALTAPRVLELLDGEALPQHLMVHRLLEYVQPALQANGDLATIDRQFAAVRAGNSGTGRSGPAPRRRPVTVRDG